MRKDLLKLRQLAGHFDDLGNAKSVKTWLRVNASIGDLRGLGRRHGCGEVKTAWTVCIACLRDSK